MPTKGGARDRRKYIPFIVIKKKGDVLKIYILKTQFEEKAIAACEALDPLDAEHVVAVKLNGSDTRALLATTEPFMLF